MPPPPTGERPLVLLAQPLFPEFAAALAGRYRLTLAAEADAADRARGRVLLVGLVPVTDDHLAGLPALQLVAGISTGVDHVDLAACRRRGLSVTNAGAAFAVDSADYAVGLLVAVPRRVAAAEAYVRAGRWAADGDYILTTKDLIYWNLLASRSRQLRLNFLPSSETNNGSTDFDRIGAPKAAKKLRDALLKVNFLGISGNFQIQDMQLASLNYTIINCWSEGKSSGFRAVMHFNCSNYK